MRDFIFMSQAQAVPAFPGHQYAPAPTADESLPDSASLVAVPWKIWATVGAIWLALTGGTWDFAWHMSIGRERFWILPHILIQTAAVLIAVCCTSAILTTTAAGSSRSRSGSVRILGLYGPGGAFIGLWGSIAMVASAPLDNWWHNAYGLDSKIVTPPHLLLSLGYFAAQIGALTWVAALINRSMNGVRVQLQWLLLLVGSVSVELLSILIMPFTLQKNMHMGVCYLVAAIFFPTMLIAVGRGSAHRWGCTIVAAIYMGTRLGSEWLLPLVPAQPKLGPVYHNVTHLVPLQFPLLLIVPAFLIDLLLHRSEGQPSWLKAMWAGPAFVISLLAVQWPFAEFLLSPASRNWIFGTAYFSYFDPAGVLYDPYHFKAGESTLGGFLLVLVLANLFSMVTARLGLGWGDWMRRVRR